MKKLILLISLLGCIPVFSQVPSIMRLAAADKPIILIIHKNDTCIFEPIYVQLGATCVTNFESFQGMVYMVTNIWGLARGYVTSNHLKNCGDPDLWAYEPIENNKLLITKKDEKYIFADINH
jgi:hypothetical protein